MRPPLCEPRRRPRWTSRSDCPCDLESRPHFAFPLLLFPRCDRRRLRELLVGGTPRRQFVGRLRVGTQSRSMVWGTSGAGIASPCHLRAPLDGAHRLDHCRSICLGSPATRAAHRCGHRRVRNRPGFAGHSIRALRLVAGAPPCPRPARRASWYGVASGRLRRGLALTGAVARAVAPRPAARPLCSRFRQRLEWVSPREMDAGPSGVPWERRNILGTVIAAARWRHSPVATVCLVAVAAHRIQPQPAGAHVGRNPRRRPCLNSATFVHSPFARWLRSRPGASKAPPLRQIRVRPSPPRVACRISRSPCLAPGLFPRRW